MEMNEKKIIKNVLKKELGSNWWFFLLRCFRKRKKIYKTTQWSNKNNDESKFVKRLLISSTLYLELQKKFDKKKAFKIMKKIIIPIGLNEMNRISNSIHERDPMEALLAFFVYIRKLGVGQFVHREIIDASKNRLEYRVKNCLFCRFYKEVKIPELAKLFCEVDTIFFPEKFPEFKFNRGSSLENTEAYGSTHCNFIFERKNSYSEV